MGSLIEQLKRQEEAARAEAGRLRARIEELQQDLARAEERASRPVSPIGAVTVLPWREGTEASVLPRTYQDLLEVAADAGRPLRAGEFAAASGLSTEKAKVEGLRSKLRLLAARPARPERRRHKEGSGNPPRPFNGVRSRSADPERTPFDREDQD